ncbi:MAG TPA: ABC transporter ATP-binding protein [Methanospirillum sp.]|nr:ABC transporter ATP-binding protein [Methanospirillum sp.]
MNNISKHFNDKPVLTGISGTIPLGKIFTIIGPSGQGKTTLLRLINLLETPTSGEILFDGISLHDPSRNQITLRRRMGMVFQTPIAFKDTVFENIAIGLKYRGVKSSDIRLRVQEKLEEIGLSGYDGRRAGTLSGGEMQRVSLARVMITEPDLLLLDEPTANLDPISTTKIEELIRYYNKKNGTTVIMSSHDLMQGQRLADQVAVMMGGRFIQVGGTIDLFSRPCSAEVARFIGIANVLPGTITQVSDGITSVDLGGVQVHAISDPAVTTGKVTVAIRPEEITLYTGPDGIMSARNTLSGTIGEIRPFGIISNVMVVCGGISLAVQVTWQSIRDMELSSGQDVMISFKAPSVHLMAYDEQRACANQ